MTDDEQAHRTAVEKLGRLGVRGVLLRLAQDSQIVDVRCEMPQCYCFRGRRHFKADIAECRLDADLDRPLSDAQDARRSPHPRQRPARASVYSQRDYLWRVRISAMLGKRMSLEKIAEQLNAEKVPTIHGTNRWTPASVRKALFPRPLPGASARPKRGSFCSTGLVPIPLAHTDLGLAASARGYAGVM